MLGLRATPRVQERKLPINVADTHRSVRCSVQPSELSSDAIVATRERRMCECVYAVRDDELTFWSTLNFWWFVKCLGAFVGPQASFCLTTGSTRLTPSCADAPSDGAMRRRRRSSGPSPLAIASFTIATARAASLSPSTTAAPSSAALSQKSSS